MNAPFPLSVALAIIPRLPRSLLSRLATRLIDRLDAIEDDPELEPCEAGDDGLHYFRERWGYQFDDGDGGILPEYGADQSQPPRNWQGIYHAPWGC